MSWTATFWHTSNTGAKSVEVPAASSVPASTHSSTGTTSIASYFHARELLCPSSVHLTLFLDKAFLEVYSEPVIDLDTEIAKYEKRSFSW
jgi:hypothetical protein